MFEDRIEAGERLAKALLPLPADALVLGIPRGGVIVAHAAAHALGADLDVIIAHKIGAPGNPELAIGAVGPDGEAVLDRAVIEAIGGVREAYVRDESARQAREIERRATLYRAGRAALHVRGRHCVVVDDGIATGSTARACLTWLRGRGASPVVLAVPVAPPDAGRRLAGTADRFVFLETPPLFGAVGQFYERFDQVTDDEVVEALRTA